MQGVISTPFELELPISDTPATPLARRRIDHVRALEVSETELVRLVRAFPTLRALYTAPADELVRVVGPQTAARIRWFLDAPLDTRLAQDASVLHTAAAPHAPRDTQSLRTAA